MLANTSYKRIHVLLQFYHILNNEERSELSNLNVTLCSYVHNNAYFASIPTKYLTDIYNLSFVRWIGEILPEDKISPIIRENRIPPGAVNPDGTVNLLVSVFEDVPIDKAKQAINKHGRVVEEPIMSNIWTVIIPNETITDLADEDAVQWIEEVMQPKKTFDGGMEVEK